MLFDALNAPLPPYYELLREMEREIPAMEQGEVIDRYDHEIQESRLPPRARRLLHDYRLVQYDLSVGGRYSQEGLFYPQVSLSSSRADEQPSQSCRRYSTRTCAYDVALDL